MEIDPVCGREVDPQHPGAQSVHDGTTYYFDSQDCKQKFDSSPTFYIGNRPVQTHGVDVVVGHGPETTSRGVDVTDYRSEETHGTDVVERHHPEATSEGVDVVEREEPGGGAE